MTRSPLQVLETVNAAQSIMEHLHARISTTPSVLDVGDLSVIQTTVRQIAELLGLAILWPRKQRSPGADDAPGAAVGHRDHGISGATSN